MSVIRTKDGSTLATNNWSKKPSVVAVYVVLPVSFNVLHAAKQL